MADHDLYQLIANLHSTDEKLCIQSIERLGLSGDDRALEPLIGAAIGDGNYSVRYQAKDALEQLSHTPHIIDLLIGKLIEDASIERIELIASLLHRTGDPRIVDPLAAARREHPDRYYLQEYAVGAAIRCHRFSAREYCDAEKVNVLVVDDEPRYRRLIAANLRTENLSAVGAENGVDGYEFSKICKPDLVVLDVMMPKLDGFSACRKIKADPNTQKIPVVLCTAKGDSDDITRGMDAGAEEYVVKPFSMSDFLKSVNEIIQKSRLGIYDKTD